jgi:glycerate-2-kinase
MMRAELIDIYQSALKAADPYRAVMNHLSLSGGTLSAAGFEYDLKAFRRIIVIGAGKGAASMAHAVEEILNDRINEGIVIVKYGHTRPLRIIVQKEAAHPLPDEAGLDATAEIVELLKKAGEETLVICLLSGGASSLLVAPAEGITLDDKREMTNLLLSAGADIRELNSVRKHLSAVKGGRLAEIAYPATVVTMILSDVIGDELDVIASGPTVPDGTDFRDALHVIHKYSLEEKIPSGVFSLLHLGVAGVAPDTPKSGAVFFQKVRNIIVGSIRQSVDAARVRAAELGFEPQILTSELQGEAQNAARFLASKALEVRSAMRPGDSPRCLLAGGETTVTVKGTGKGGRNQELALAFALEIAGREGFSLLSAGTDGTDGPTDAAGAMVDGTTAPKACELGMNPKQYLANNDSYTFFQKFDELSGGNTHIMTGPTGTNVMDLQIMIVENPASGRDIRFPSSGGKG